MLPKRRQAVAAKKTETSLHLEPLESRILLSTGLLTEAVSLEGAQTAAAAQGRIIVGFEGDPASAARELTDTYPEAQILHQYQTTKAAVVGLPEGTSVEEGLAAVIDLPGVRYAEPDYIVTATQVFPDDPDFSELWGLHNTGQTGGTLDADIDAPEAWTLITGSSDIIVGVIDSGIDYAHPDLAANMWTNPGEIPDNGLDDDSNGYVDDYYGWDFANDDSDPWDDDGHGTHVAGTIGAVGNDGVGIAGINWTVRLAALKFLDASGVGWTSDAVEAVEYATAMGFDLTNNSWGGGGYTQTLYDAIAAAGAAGQLFVAAAGNSGLDNDLSPHYPSSYDLDSIIAVAATDHNDQLASFSNYGATSVDLAAPGVNIYSTLPGNNYDWFNGTSMAAPHVAGAAALLKAYNPLLSALEIKAALMDSVDPVPGLGGLMVTGGRLNVRLSLDALAPPVEGIDIVPRTFTIASADLSGLGYLSGSYVVANVGDTGFTDDFVVDLYFSDDVLVGADDHLLDSYSIVGGLAAFSSHTRLFQITDVPVADPFGADGDYFMLLSVDRSDVVAEVNEGNNLRDIAVNWDGTVFFQDDFSTDRGWTGYASNRWERGPAEAGGGQFGFPDPSADTTPTGDNYLLGYNIGGDYQNYIFSTRWITSPVIDCSDATDVSLRFQRWLNVESPWYDLALIEVYDGNSWQNIFLNQSQIADSRWRPQNYDVSDYADNNGEFRVRFGMGPTDFSWQFSGWNIDDVFIVGNLPPDNVPPQVSRVNVSPSQIAPTVSLDVTFSEGMALYPLSELSHYSLVDSIGDPVDITSVDPGPDRVGLEIGAALVPGEQYTLTIAGGGLVDNAGNPLDGNRDGVGGDDFEHSFTLPGLFAGRIDAYGGHLTFYDTDAQTFAEIDVGPVALVTGTPLRGITQVILRPQYSPFGVVIEQRPGSSQPMAILDRTFRPHQITYLVVDGNVSVLSLVSELTGMNINGLALGENVALPQDIDGDGVTNDQMAFVATGVGRGDVGLFRSSAVVGGDVAVGGNLNTMMIVGPFADLNADVTVAGNLGLFRMASGDFDGNLAVGGRLSVLSMASDMAGQVTAGSIGSAFFNGPGGVLGSVTAETGDIGLLRSLHRIRGPISAPQGRINRLIALDGTDAAGTVTAGSGLGYLFSRGTVRGDITVTGGDVGTIRLLGGDLDANLDVQNSNVQGLFIVNAGLAANRTVNIAGTLNVLQIRNPAGADSMADSSAINVGEYVRWANLVGDMKGEFTVGSGANGDGVGLFSLRGDLDGEFTVNGDVNVAYITGGHVTSNGAPEDPRIDVDGDVNLLSIRNGWAGALENDSGVRVTGRLGRALFFGDVRGNVTAGSPGGHDGLGLLFTSRDLSSNVTVNGSLSRVVIRGNATGSELSVLGGRLDVLTVLGDATDADFNVDGTLQTAYVGGSFTNSSLSAGKLVRVTVRGTLSGQGQQQGAWPDRIHAAGGSFTLFAGGRFYPINGTDINLGGVLASVD